MNQPLSAAWRLRTTTAALLIPPLIYLVSLERLTNWIARRRAVRAGPVWDVALAEWVDRVLRKLPPPWRHTCLKRAVTLLYLTRRSGGAAELKVGVRRNEAGELTAHAWLVREGQLYLESGTERIESFQVLASFPAGPTTEGS
jgi:transglutaminase superfamily protein